MYYIFLYVLAAFTAYLLSLMYKEYIFEYVHHFNKKNV